MILNFYDIPVKYLDKGICRDGSPIEVYRYESERWGDFNLGFFESDIFDSLIYKDDFINALELDKKYYILKNNEEIFGVISLHKGYTYIDCAEYDERVIIKCGFPHLRCDIVGEK